MDPVTFKELKVWPLNIPVDDDNYELVQDWCYIWEDDGFNMFFIRKGFVYDGASVPAIGALVDLHPDNLFRAACIPHDALYILADKEYPEGMFKKYIDGQWFDADFRFTRKQADKMLYKILLESGMNKIKAWLSYTAVRIGGWVPWRDFNHKEYNNLMELYE